ncbi:unnamed protein product [Amoebophrya sp. A120]|nr:unnamed protein product [Amoebophrya sp. A120]|eukprot:GSA120T00013964001.1
MKTPCPPVRGRFPTAGAFFAAVSLQDQVVKFSSGLRLVQEVARRVAHEEHAGKVLSGVALADVVDAAGAKAAAEDVEDATSAGDACVGITTFAGTLDDELCCSGQTWDVSNGDDCEKLSQAFTILKLNVKGMPGNPPQTCSPLRLTTETSTADVWCEGVASADSDADSSDTATPGELDVSGILAVAANTTEVADACMSLKSRMAENSATCCGENGWNATADAICQDLKAAHDHVKNIRDQSQPSPDMCQENVIGATAGALECAAPVVGPELTYEALEAATPGGGTNPETQIAFCTWVAPMLISAQEICCTDQDEWDTNKGGDVTLADASTRPLCDHLERHFVHINGKGWPAAECTKPELFPFPLNSACTMALPEVPGDLNAAGILAVQVLDLFRIQSACKSLARLMKATSAEECCDSQTGEWQYSAKPPTCQEITDAHSHALTLRLGSAGPEAGLCADELIGGQGPGEVVCASSEIVVTETPQNGTNSGNQTTTTTTTTTEDEAVNIDAKNESVSNSTTSAPEASLHLQCC